MQSAHTRHEVHCVADGRVYRKIWRPRNVRHVFKMPAHLARRRRGNRAQLGTKTHLRASPPACVPKIDRPSLLRVLVELGWMSSRKICSDLVFRSQFVDRSTTAKSGQRKESHGLVRHARKRLAVDVHHVLPAACARRARSTV